MHLFLIRHGETEHNVAGLLAGVTDSKLTNHGVLQTQRLAKHLTSVHKLQFTHIFASDLKRASMTAEEIRKAQTSCAGSPHRVEVTQLELLREQDFGSLELTKWSSMLEGGAAIARALDPTNPDFKPKETKEAMSLRAKQFLDDFIMPLSALDGEIDLCIAIVSHGLFLASLWRALLHQFSDHKVVISPDVGFIAPDRPLTHLPSWSNTGYLELKITFSANSEVTTSCTKEVKDKTEQPTGSIKSNACVTVLAVNSKDHLSSFKRQRGGLGSVAYDERQTKLEGFFKKQKLKATRPKPKEI